MVRSLRTRILSRNYYQRKDGYTIKLSFLRHLRRARDSDSSRPVVYLAPLFTIGSICIEVTLIYFPSYFRIPGYSFSLLQVGVTRHQPSTWESTVSHRHVLKLGSWRISLLLSRWLRRCPNLLKRSKSELALEMRLGLSKHPS